MITTRKHPNGTAHSSSRLPLDYNKTFHGIFVSHRQLPQADNTHGTGHFFLWDRVPPVPRGWRSPGTSRDALPFLRGSHYFWRPPSINQAVLDLFVDCTLLWSEVRPQHGSWRILILPLPLFALAPVLGPSSDVRQPRPHTAAGRRVFTSKIELSWQLHCHPLSNTHPRNWRAHCPAAMSIFMSRIQRRLAGQNGTPCHLWFVCSTVPSPFLL